MPAQHTCCGRPVTLRMPPRRFQFLLALVAVFALTILTLGPRSSADFLTYEQVTDAVKNPHLPTLPELPPLPQLPSLPKVPNPLGPSAHKPPVQANSSASSVYGAIDWLSNYRWRNPFSSSVTFDENRAVLPPLPNRPPVYTYYETLDKKNKAVQAAENRLLLAWRRAWWAQGFRPQVLSRAEALRHPHYELVQRMKLDPKVEVEIMRWLAWGHMGGGILANWLALPVAAHDNPMIAFLRREEYPKLSRVDSLFNGLFFGGGAAVNDAVKKALNNDLMKNVTRNSEQITTLAGKDGGMVVNLLPSKDIAVDKKANGIAYYSQTIISNNYKTIADKLTNETLADGLDLLADLINSHLHLTFQESYPEGIAVVMPLPEHTTTLMHETLDVARNLTQCPSTPAPKSCPPNRPKCKPCDHRKPMKLQLKPSYQNVTGLFSMGVVPHPYTLTSLHFTRDTVDTSFLRNSGERNIWLYALTVDLLGPVHTDELRVVDFKQLLAAPHAPSLWATAERPTQQDLDWIFGFRLPQSASPTPESSPSSADRELILSPRPALPGPIEGTKAPDEKTVQNEEMRLRKAREVVRKVSKHTREVVDMVEKWNLADTEAWRFARAYAARRRMERKKWEEEEGKFAGSERRVGAGAGSGAGRWSDGR